MSTKVEDLAKHRELRRPEPRPKAAAADRSSRRCPICGAVPASRYRPFCSARCADVDLARWLNGRYSVPGDPVADPVDSEPD